MLLEFNIKSEQLLKPLKHILNYIQQFQHSKVLHGSIIQLYKPSENKNNFGSNNLKKYVLINDGCQGIGKQAAIVMASKGNDLVLTCNRKSKIQQNFKNQLQKLNNVTIQICELDFLKPNTLNELVDHLKNESINFSEILFNGEVQTFNPKSQKTQHEKFQKQILSANTKGPIQLYELLNANNLLSSNCMVTIVSTVSSQTSKESDWIDLMSKEILESWKQSILKSHNVSAINLGPVNTQVLQESHLIKQGNEVEEFKKKIPKQTIINSKNIATLIEMTQQTTLKQYFKNLQLNASCGFNFASHDFPYTQLQSLKQKYQVENQQQLEPLQKLKANQSDGGQIQKTKQEKKVLMAHQSHFKSQQDSFSTQNPKGFVNFGVSINLPNMQKIVQYFPKFMNVSNFQYTMANLEKNLNYILSKDSPYTSYQTFAKNNLLTVVAIHASTWQKISFQGNYDQLSVVQSFSNCKIVPKNQSNCHIIFYPNTQTIEHYLGTQSEQKILIVVADPKDVIKTDKKNVFYAFQLTFEGKYTCGVCFFKDQSVQQLFAFHFSNLQFSTFVSATIQRIFKGLQPSQHQQLKIIQQEPNYMETFTEMLLRQSSEIIVHKENVFLTIGAGSALANLGFALFNKDNRLLLDRPYYFGFIPDFEKSGISFEFQDLFSGTLKSKAEKAYADGLKGYLIVNPHNPSGKVYDRKQIYQVCEWAKCHPQFHLIFDEMYRNSIFENCQTMSAINYTNNFENIHVIRGFAKDFSLCGFKVAMLISSNKTVKQKFTKWQKIICPQQSVLKAVARMIRQTDFGKVFFREVKNILQKTNKLAFELLKQKKIPFIPPQGGCFLIIDLRDYLRKSGMSEIQFWLRMSYDYKVNITMGKCLGFQEEGYFRLCHVVDQKSILEGIERIGALCQEFLQKINE